MLWAAAPGRRCAELSGNTASKASAENAIKISRALMAWLYRSEEHTSELQSLMRISYAVFCLKKINHPTTPTILLLTLYHIVIPRLLCIPDVVTQPAHTHYTYLFLYHTL